MALTIDTTLEGTTANSYATVAEVDAYHETRLHNTDWTGITDTEIKKAAIIWATRTLDSYMRWKGIRKTTTQALQWPRLYAYDHDGYVLGYDYSANKYIIAQDIKNAVAELAFLLVQSDKMSESIDNPLTSLKVDVIDLKFNAKGAADIIPKSVSNIIREYGSYIKSNPGSVPLVRA